MINKISLSIPNSPDPHFISSNTHETKSPPSPPPPPPQPQAQPYNPMGSSSPLAAVESIHHYLSEICSVPDENYSWENPRRFSSYIKRLQLVLNQFLRSNTDQSFSASVLTALKGISGDLIKSSETLSSYRERSKIYVLINSEALRSSLQQRTVAIGGWLALLGSSVNLESNPDLHKKTIDLSRDMKLSQFPVTENEERVYCTLRKEADGRHTSKAVQSAIMMDLARALGTDNDNLSELQEQIKLLRNDVASSNSIAERRILNSLERIFNSWSLDPTIAAETFGLDCEEDTQIQPFKNFLCPLTKEVMKYPVVLESSQTYERSAIEYWFERCIGDGRDPTCPVTGKVLKSLEQKPNIGLAGAIEEWVNRNVDIQIKSAVECLDVEYPSGGCPLPVENIERVCDRIYKISEDHPSSRYKIRNEGVDVLIVKMLKKCSKNIRSHLRSKALMALVSVAKNDECKQVMLQEGATRLAIHSLIGSSEKEKEYAVKLLLEFSNDESYCTSIASEKGALVLLSSMAGDLEHPSLCNLAEEVLKRLEKVDENVHPLAAAGRFEPLLSRLREGTEEVQIEMASMVGKMTLANNSKEQIARQGSKIFLDMLSKPEGKEPSLQCLCNLSSSEDNATILVDSGVLLAVVEILFQAEEDDKQHLKDIAASIAANIVSKPGHWELACVNDEGDSMQSESIVHNLLRILPLSSPKGEVAILHILHGIASSPQASESVATHIESGDGVATILQFLEHGEAEHRNYAFRLTRILSDRLGQVLVDELRASNSISLLKDKLLDTERSDSERSDSACILANLPLTEDEVQTVLGASLIKWIVTSLKSSEKTSRLTSSMIEGLLGLLLHFVRFPDANVLHAVREHRLMTVFKDQLCSQQPRLRQRAALGLKYLSECGRTLVASTDFQPQPSTSFFSSIFFCGRASKVTQSCPIHSFACEDESQFCLFKGNCIRPLLDLLNDEDTSAQITAVEALSTLVYDTPSCSTRAADELERLGVSDAVIELFTEVRTGELQEKTIWMLERILRVESHAQRYAINQSLVRALVEAFKHGNTNTKRHAQDALTSLKQISGVSGKNSSQGKMRR
ncbi:hypothetical protein C5167_028551 [Papaver somniferum]|uniref:U-box domain-containing protein 43-like n=1 Tax=Papaver somniferum TaxID=3469 RepID=UPI000E70219F|nr:U-box domain-containing protein 43-like [Papaver somniferum]RZC90718.1 hypothetical protein C5167_028551 [Papaver somniferum]